MSTTSSGKRINGAMAEAIYQLLIIAQRRAFPRIIMIKNIFRGKQLNSG